jgi:hypothetical protein
MSPKRITPIEEISRFKGKMRHSHRASKNSQASWDDWIGDKKKTQFRQKFDRVILTIIIVIIGLVLSVGAFGLIFFIMKKIMNMMSH